MATLVAEHETPTGQRIRLFHGDLTEEAVDAIVNAANPQWVLGGGVAGAIARRGGPSIQEECRRHPPGRSGDAILTGAGQLPARYVIHAAGPRWGEGDEPAKLRRAMLNALALAEAYGVRSIAFPAISSGIFGFPKDRCAEVLVQAALDFCADHPQSTVREIRFTLIDEPTVAAFRAEFERRWGAVSPAP